MPLAYTAAPIPAAAVLSGAAVKAGVIGLIRFLPLSAAFPGWGEALAWAGFISAFYGVAIGLTQRDPKTVLAYSSISQMGVIAAVFGLGLVGADRGAASDAAFYAANHVLVKAALFLTVGVAAALERARRSLALIVAAALALSLGGLPLTGGALAKLAVKGPLGDGLGQRCRGGVRGRDDGSDAAFPHPSRAIGQRRARRRRRARISSWLALAVASMLVPWLMFPALGGDLADALAAANAVGCDLADARRRGARRRPVGLRANRSRAFPPATFVVAAGGRLPRQRAVSAPLFERLDWRLRQWPAAGLSLLTIALALAAAGLAAR